MSVFALNAKVRSDTGKGSSRRLRRLADEVPAIIYGAGEDPVLLALDHNKIKQALELEAFYSHILTLNIDGKKQKAVLKALQRHPAKRQILHVDFLRVTGKEKITMHVPLHFLNEETAPGVKQGGQVSHTMTDFEVNCLPKDLPEFIEIDLANLDMDQTIHVSDVALPQGVELVDKDNDQPVVSIHKPKLVVEEEETPEETAEEGEAGEAGEEKPENGDE